MKRGHLIQPVCSTGHQLTTAQHFQWLSDVREGLTTWKKILQDNPSVPHCCRAILTTTCSPYETLQYQLALHHHLPAYENRGFLSMYKPANWMTEIGDDQRPSVVQGQVVEYVESNRRSNSAPSSSRRKREPNPDAKKRRRVVVRKDNTNLLDMEKESDQIKEFKVKQLELNEEERKERIALLKAIDGTTAQRQRLLTRPLPPESLPPTLQPGYIKPKHTQPPTNPLIINSSLSNIASLSDYVFRQSEFHTRHSQNIENTDDSIHTNNAGSTMNIHNASSTMNIHNASSIMNIHNASSIMNNINSMKKKEKPRSSSMPPPSHPSYPSTMFILQSDGTRHPLPIPSSFSYTSINMNRNDNSTNSSITISSAFDKETNTLYWRNDDRASQDLLWTLANLDSLHVIVERQNAKQPLSIDIDWIVNVWRMYKTRTCHVSLVDLEREKERERDVEDTTKEKIKLILSPSESLLLVWSTQASWEASKIGLQLELVSGRCHQYDDDDLFDYWKCQEDTLSFRHIRTMKINSTLVQPWRVSATRLYELLKQHE